MSDFKFYEAGRGVAEEQAVHSCEWIMYGGAGLLVLFTIFVIGYTVGSKSRSRGDMRRKWKGSNKPYG